MNIAITGGAGYVGSMLTPHLVKRGHRVTVLDTFWYGDTLFDHPSLRKIKGDIRNKTDLRAAFTGQDAVIHLACISNDPSFDMNPSLGKSINLDCFMDILSTCNTENVGRFLYASSSSVYGLSERGEVTEDSPRRPLTDYSKYKLACETMIKTYGMGGVWTILRPATVCGYSPRMRLDLVVNILTIQALVNKRITLFGQSQKRPNINIMDMVAAYEMILNAYDNAIDQQTYNVGFENLTLLEIATLVQQTIGDPEVVIALEPTKDPRSYHVNSDKIRELGFKPVVDIAQAIQSIKRCYKEFKDPMNNPVFYNIKQMKELAL